MSNLKQFLVRHEVYEQPGECGRVLVQEYEDTVWLWDFFKVGHTDYVEGNPLHTWTIEATI